MKLKKGQSTGKSVIFTLHFSVLYVAFGISCIAFDFIWISSTIILEPKSCGCLSEESAYCH
jgi:hypothetical protein